MAEIEEAAVFVVEIEEVEGLEIGAVVVFVEAIEEAVVSAEAIVDLADRSDSPKGETSRRAKEQNLNRYCCCYLVISLFHKN